MKRILTSIFCIFALFETVVVFGATTYQPMNLGWVNISIASNTVAVINASTAPTVGYPWFCTDCAGGGGKGTVCISTSIAAPGAGSDFVLSTGTQCK